MDYASIVCGRYPKMVNNDRMSKLQKRSARVILRCKIIDISNKDLFNTMNWMPFYDRVTYKRCLLRCTKLTPLLYHNTYNLYHL